MLKRYSWRSYSFLILSLLVSLSMILLDPIAVATSVQVGSLIVIFILVDTVASVVLAVLAFSYKKEKKNIAVIALFVTIINVAIITLFLWFGMKFAS